MVWYGVWMQFPFESELRQRHAALTGVGFAQPVCQPAAGERCVVGRLGSLPAMVFVGAFSFYILIGAICALTPPNTKTTVVSHDVPTTAMCMRAARHADYVSVELNIGSPGRRLYVLIRWDKVVEPSESPLRLFEARIMESHSMQCNGVNKTCVDSALLNNGSPNGAFKRQVVSFDYTAAAVERATYGVAGYMLNLDGEMYMKRGYKYWMTATHVCYAPSTDLVPTTASGALKASVSNGLVYASATALAHVSADSLGSSFTREATVNFLCDNSTLSGIGTVAILPSIAAVEAVYLALSDAHLYESEPTTVSSRRKVVELGNACASILPSLERDYNLYLLDCNNAQSACAQSASLPFRRISRLDMMAHYDSEGSVAYYFEKSHTLDTLPNLSVTSDAIGLAVVKLVLVLMAAALVWVRSDRVTSKPHWLYRHCIQAAHCVAIQAPPSGASSVIEDASFGLLAAVSRFAVSLWRYETLQYDAQSRVCIVEMIAAVLSLVHWLARFWMIDPWLPELVNGKSDGRGPLTRLGGSSAIIDASSSVLLAFSQAPMLLTAVPRFDPTARLLIGMLISMVALPRCLFSAACCSLLYEAGQVGKSRIEPAFSLMLILSIVFWILQLVALSISINDLMVTPLSYSLSRGTVGGTGWISLAISLGLVTSGAPRLLNSAVRLGEPH